MVEVDIAQGLPQFATVGIAEEAVKESKGHFKSAINNPGYEFPTRRITINLAPADLRKEGGAFDLPIEKVARFLLLPQVTARLGLSASRYTRLLKVGRMIADVAGATEVDATHLTEDVQYRFLDHNRP